MKSYSLTKKLRINKKTVANLTDATLNDIRGGIPSEKEACGSGIYDWTICVTACNPTCPTIYNTCYNGCPSSPCQNNTHKACFAETPAPPDTSDC